eukprot:s1062_g7.t1
MAQSHVRSLEARERLAAAATAIFSARPYSIVRRARLAGTNPSECALPFPPLRCMLRSRSLVYWASLPPSGRRTHFLAHGRAAPSCRTGRRRGHLFARSPRSVQAGTCVAVVGMFPTFGLSATRAAYVVRAARRPVAMRVHTLREQCGRKGHTEAPTARAPAFPLEGEVAIAPFPILFFFSDVFFVT